MSGTNGRQLARPAQLVHGHRRPGLCSDNENMMRVTGSLGTRSQLVATVGSGSTGVLDTMGLKQLG